MPAIEPACSSDLPALCDLISAAGLPLDGLGAVPADVLVARAEASIVGTATLEHHDGDGLIRSVAVDVHHRRTGIGAALVAAIEARAVELGFPRLYLLTETAEAFFFGRGYEVIDRDHGPEAIMRSVEWSQACGASAIPMMRAIS